MASKNPEEIAKAAQELESKGDPKSLLPEDKELLQEAKESAKNSSLTRGKFLLVDIHNFLKLRGPTNYR